MLSYILYGLFILSCLILIVVVLLQPGKADAGALFSNTLSSTAFGPRGTASLLAKITIGAAAAFMLIALALGLPILSGSRSVLQSTPAAPVASPSPTAAPAQQQVPLSVPATSPATAPAASPSSSKAPASPSK
ncbi:MAG TPA: preprotein translocase subunit SecG [Pyrinomonadaceae bacterium]|nr:preprotein translocase subunit SecG [Pyrinomonadaceae bacterium]